MDEMQINTSQFSDQGIRAAIRIINDFYELDKPQDFEQTHSGYYKKRFDNFTASVKSIFPAPLLEQWSMSQYNCDLGLFPEINRVWVIVDNKLFLWNYEDQSDFLVFDELDQIIVSIGLVKSKPGVFLENINYLFVIATQVEILLLGVFEDDDQIVLKPTKFAIPTDNIRILKIVGTDQGRIFMCGEDGSLYELFYQIEDGWFQKKCYKKNHSSYWISPYIPNFLKISTLNDPLIGIAVDDSRHILYTLSKKSVISIYDLGISGQETHLVVSENQKRHYSHLDQVNGGSFSITGIFAIPYPESSLVHLVAVTQNGSRLCFSTNATPFSGDLTIRPQTLYLLFDKQPAESNPSISVSYYSNFAFFYANKSNRAANWVTAIEREWIDPGIELKGNVPNLGESITKLQFNEEIFEIAEVPRQRICPASVWELFEYDSSSELVTQHALPRRSILCLTKESVIEIEKLRPVDELAKLLIASKGNDSNSFNDFSLIYGPIQLSAMCIILACSSEESLSSLAVSYFFRHGGHPTIETVGYHPNRPHDEGRKIVHSILHNSFACHISRVLRPLWNANIFMEVKGGFIRSRFLSSQLQYIKSQILQLHAFLLRPQFGIDSNVLPSDEARQLEINSLRNLRQLIERSIEAISFLDTLSGMDIDRGILDPKAQKTILSRKFSQFILIDYDILRGLVNGLIYKCSSEINPQAVKKISEDLRDSCPSFFSKADSSRLQAYDTLQRTKSVDLDHETRLVLLKSSLKQFIAVADQLDLKNLNDICATFQFLRFYDGIVHICLACAHVTDPNKDAWKWFNSGRRMTDRSGDLAFNRVSECYRPILNALYELYPESYSNDDLMNGENGSSLPSSTPVFLHRPSLGEQNWLQLQTKTLKVAIDSNDEMWHVFLYQWFLNRNMASELVKLDTPYLENFLINFCDPEKRLYLLWVYYLYHEQLEKSAKTLLLLANRDERLTLDDRLETLTKAYSLVQGQANVDPRVLKEIKDTLSILSIQRKVYRELDCIGDPEQIAGYRNLLDKKLYTVTELFNEFAKPLGLRESSLTLFSESGYQDDKLVHKLWETIILEEIQVALNNNLSPESLVPLSHKLTQLAQEYYPNEYIFPLPFLVDFLECKSFELSQKFGPGWYNGWVVNSLLNSGVLTHSTLFKVYKELEGSISSYWQGQDQAIFLFDVIYHLLESWKNASGQNSDFQNKSVLITIEKYIEILKKYSSLQASELLEKYKSLRSSSILNL